MRKLVLKEYLKDKKSVIETALNTFMLPAEGPFREHIEAMRYSLFVGGKRVRPILCLAAAESVAENEDIDHIALPIACALECIHTYSLIHDDLPAMDNDALRRGKPTNHVVYGEAEAILAGDGLLTFAFELLSGNEAVSIPPKVRLQIIQVIAKAAGSAGMVGGQALDIANEGKNIPYEALRIMHKSKTGALITASAACGALIAGATPEQLRALTAYGDNIGLAFQIADDLLDIESTTEELGKPVGSDLTSHKVTYPSLFGLERSKAMGREAVEAALAALAPFNHFAEPLRALAVYIIERKN